MVQINLSLANVVLHSDNLRLMEASGYCIFLPAGVKVSACEVHTLIEELKQTETSFLKLLFSFPSFYLTLLLLLLL